MYICNIDESVTSNIPGNTLNYVIDGILISGRQWKNCDKEKKKKLRGNTVLLGRKYMWAGCYGHIKNNAVL